MENLERSSNIIVDGANKETKVGILSDKTGFGKSFCVIGLLCRDKMIWDVDTPYIYNEPGVGTNKLVNIYNIQRFRKINTSLIVVNGTILKQWEEYLSYSNLKYVSIRKTRNVEEITPEEYDVVLCPVKHYNLLMSVNSKIAWKRFVYDEPGHTKITKMKNINSGFIWFITATPKAILQQYRCSKSGFIKEKFICNIFTSGDYTDMISGLCIDNEEETLKKSFLLPENINIHYKCHQPVYKVVCGLVSSKIDTMIEAGNIEGAILALGGERTCNLIELIKCKKKKELEVIYEKMENSCKNPSKILRIKERIEKQLLKIDERYGNFLKQTCSICLEQIDSPVLETNCQNIFCGKCLLTWLKDKKTCPLCVKDVHTKDLVYIKRNEKKKNIEIKFEKKMTKDEQVLDIIVNSEKSKFILFSEYDSFENVMKKFIEKGIKFLCLKGILTKLEKNIESYKNGDIDVIILNAKNNGAGLNLQETTDIILYHKISEDMFKQIIGRANRIGRKDILKIHHLKV